jgi:hypothetical protein
LDNPAQTAVDEYERLVGPIDTDTLAVFVSSSMRLTRGQMADLAVEVWETKKRGLVPTLPPIASPIDTVAQTPQTDLERAKQQVAIERVAEDDKLEFRKWGGHYSDGFTREQIDIWVMAGYEARQARTISLQSGDLDHPPRRAGYKPPPVPPGRCEACRGRMQWTVTEMSDGHRELVTWCAISECIQFLRNHRQRV